MEQQNKFIKEIAQIAGLVGGAAKTGAQFLGDVRNMSRHASNLIKK